MNTPLHFFLLCQSCHSFRNVGLSFGGRILGLIKSAYHGWLSMMTSSEDPFSVLPRAPTTSKPPLIMPKVKQPNSSKIRGILHEYASEFTSTPKGELVCKFCVCLENSDKRFMVEAHRRSAKHKQSSFHETESSQTFLKHAKPDFADELLFVSFQQNKLISLFSNTVYQARNQGGHLGICPPEIFKTLHSNFDICRNFQRIKMKFFILIVFKKSD